MGMAALLGLGVGTLNCVLIGFFPTWKNVWGVVTRPLFLVSGIFYTYDSVPAAFQHVLWYNPLVHVVGMMRSGFYGVYRDEYISVPYVLGDRAGNLRDRGLAAAPARQPSDRAVSASPAVSVIMPVWNARATLGEAADSVLAQSMSDTGDCC